MSVSAWRLLSLPILVAALLLVGSPDFPAFRRAVEKAFPTQTLSAPVPAAEPAPTDRPDDGSGRASVLATERPRGVLLPLYVSFAALQALDAHSTLRALDNGAAEANPLMAGLAGTPAALVAVKAGVAASTIYLVEKVRVKSRGAAIALMVALNSAYAAIVAHNYRTTRR